MFRITNRMMYNNTLVNAFRNNQGLLAAQEQISSGKRINRPSDDPTGMMEVLQLRTRIGKSEQYLKIMDTAEASLNTADTTIGTIGDELKSAKELAIQQANGTADGTTRANIAQRIDNMVESMVQYGNTTVGGKYIFSGLKSESPAIDANGNYAGSGKEYKAEISKGIEVPISVKASDFLTADLNPSASTTSTVASLNGGTGVPAGTFTITDRSGTATVITVNPGDTLGNVMTAMTAIPAITASISTDGASLVLTDSTAAPINALSITDTGGTGTAAALGILGTRTTSSFTGSDLDPAVTATTALSDLNGGAGLALDDFRLVNGSASATVTFGAEATVGALMTTINTAAATINATVTIDADQRKLAINSNTATSVAFALDSDVGQTAELLGLGGGRNIIPVLKTFSAALKADDLTAILGSIDRLNSVMENTSSVRGAVGARANQVAITRSSEDASKFDNTKIKSFVEDADYLAAASELAMLQTAYQATLKSSAAIVQPTLMDFIG